MTEPMTDERFDLNVHHALIMSAIGVLTPQAKDCIVKSVEAYDKEIRRLRAELRDTKEELEDVTNDLGGKTHMLMKAEVEVERLKVKLSEKENIVQAKTVGHDYLYADFKRLSSRNQQLNAEVARLKEEADQRALELIAYGQKLGRLEKKLAAHEEATHLLAYRANLMVKQMQMMLDGYNSEHPLDQKSWEMGIVFTARKQVELVQKALEPFRASLEAE